MCEALSTPLCSAAEARRPDQNVAEARFADIRRAMIGGEALDQRRGIGPLAVHEDMLVRHEDFIEDDERFLAGELRIAGIQGAAVDDAGVVGLPPDDVGQPRRIDAHRADDRPIAVGFGQPHGGHEDEPMRMTAPVWCILAPET
jgi:hypothetical protein